MNDVFHYVAYNLAKALSAFLQRDSYLYWPYLVSSAAIALWAWRWLGEARDLRRPWREFFRDYFCQDIWWHRSARADYALYFANAVLLPGLFALLWLDERQLAALVDSAAGVAEHVGAAEPGPLPRLLFTVAFFIAYDLGRFVMHCLLHDVPLLWEFHKIHHSAEVLTPVTSFRAHPLELLLMAWGPAVTTGLVVIAFNAVWPGSANFYSFLGLHIFFFAFNLIDNLRHSPVWVSYGPTWGRWFVSPAHHQVHHSSEPRHLGCNRGFDLAIWDRLYGTLYVPGIDPEKFKLGLGDGADASYHHVGRMYLLPFAAVARGVARPLRRYFRAPSAR